MILIKATQQQNNCKTQNIARMKQILRGLKLAVLLIAILACQNKSDKTTENEYPIHIDSLCIHDPCILADSVTGLYYAYGNYSPKKKWHYVKFPFNRGGVQAYMSKDLQNWSLPRQVFTVPDNFWADSLDAPWAPEVHFYNNKYYLFVTFNKWDSIMDSRPNRPKITWRASQILVADSPLGPFEPFHNKPTTIDGEMTLDATFYVEDGQPYIVYCHEWVQIGPGEMKAAKLSPDLSETIEAPFTLFSASDVSWNKDSVNYRGTRYYGSVTDGCYFYKTKNGTLLMLWSSWHKTRQYAQAIAYSESGSIKGPWKHLEEPILMDDRGHGMVFKGFDDKLYLSLHRYFHTPETRLQIWELEDTGDMLEVKKQLWGAL